MKKSYKSIIAWLISLSVFMGQSVPLYAFPEEKTENASVSGTETTVSVTEMETTISFTQTETTTSATQTETTTSATQMETTAPITDDSSNFSYTIDEKTGTLIISGSGEMPPL